MSKNTAIEWTDHTFNPWWGCTKISPGCRNCYAATFAHRLGKDCWGDDAKRLPMSEDYWHQPIAWNAIAARAQQPAKVFCGSMCDVFEEADFEAIHDGTERLYSTVDATPWLIWQLLTKRPENVPCYLPGGGLYPLAPTDKNNWLTFPRLNVWLGTSAEDQLHADRRCQLLKAIPASIRFVSVEPMLGPVSLKRHFACDACYDVSTIRTCGIGCKQCDYTGLAIHWVIIGGESGRGARPCYLRWISDLVMECKIAGVAVFIKQLGSKPVAEETAKTRAPASPWYFLTKDSKGGNPKEWPAGFPRDRAFPPYSVKPLALSKCP